MEGGGAGHGRGMSRAGLAIGWGWSQAAPGSGLTLQDPSARGRHGRQARQNRPRLARTDQEQERGLAVASRQGGWGRRPDIGRFRAMLARG